MLHGNDTDEFKTYFTTSVKDSYYFTCNSQFDKKMSDILIIFIRKSSISKSIKENRSNTIFLVVLSSFVFDLNMFSIFYGKRSIKISPFSLYPRYSKIRSLYNLYAILAYSLENLQGTSESKQLVNQMKFNFSLTIFYFSTTFYLLIFYFHITSISCRYF